MRICVFTCNGNLAALEKKELLCRVNCPLEEHEVGEIYVVSYHGQFQSEGTADGVAGSRFYVAEPRNRRAEAGRRLLRAVDVHQWIPPLSSFAPLCLFREDLLEVLLGCDPDIVVIQQLRWASQLKRLIRKSYPHWACLAEGDAWPDVEFSWRRFDPSVKVSIVLPTYNGSKYLRQSIESCLNQTFGNIELIIVDDGSTEDVPKIVNSCVDSRIKFFRHERNRGLAEALNTGFQNSTGAYLTWTSDDNYYAETAVEELVRFLQTHPRVDLVYAEMYDFDERKVDHGWRIRRNLPVSSLEILHDLPNGIGACFLYNRKVYEAIGNYDARAFLVEDYDYWIRVSKRFRMQRLFKPLYYYRCHEESLTGRHSVHEINKNIRLVWQRNQKSRQSPWRRMLGLIRARGNQELDTSA